MIESWLFNWVIWFSIAVGISVGGLVFFVSRGLGIIGIGRRNRTAPRGGEELPWEQMLELLKQRYEGRSAADEALSPDELMEVLLGEVAKTSSVPEGAHWSVPPDHDDRRSSKRRWSNPVDVRLISPLHENLVHGLVFNRSTGGLAILTDVAIAPDTLLSVRAVQAPQGIGYASIRVRHARQVSKLWVIGCEYAEEVPWNVKVWFG